MVNENQPHVKHAERVTGGLVITFDDGSSALFSSELLYSTLELAKEIPDSLEEDEA